MDNQLLDEMIRRQDTAWSGLTSAPLSRRARRDARAAYTSHQKEISDAEVMDQIRAVPTHHAGAGVRFATGAAAARSRWLSDNIFGQFAVGNIREDRSLGGFMIDDFMNWNGIVASNRGNYATESGSWRSFESTSGTLLQVNTIASNATLSQQTVGAIEFLTTAATSNTVAMEGGGGVGGSWGITGNNAPQLAFECRVAISKTAVTGLDTFIGMAAPGAAVTMGASSIIGTADTINQKSYIGFWSLTAAPTVINAGYGKVSTAGVIPTVATAGVWAAPVSSVPQFTKLGWVYDQRQPVPLLKFYQDGTLISVVNDCSVAAFPTGLTLVPLLAIFSDASAAAAVKMQVDWSAVVMLF